MDFSESLGKNVFFFLWETNSSRTFAGQSTYIGSEFVMELALPKTHTETQPHLQQFLIFSLSQGYVWGGGVWWFRAVCDFAILLVRGGGAFLEPPSLKGPSFHQKLDLWPSFPLSLQRVRPVAR